MSALNCDACGSHEGRRPMAERLDAGDLDAALARVDVYGNSLLGLTMICRCGEGIYPEEGKESLLDLVNYVAEHQPTCPQVKK